MPHSAGSGKTCRWVSALRLASASSRAIALLVQESTVRAYPGSVVGVAAFAGVAVVGERAVRQGDLDVGAEGLLGEQLPLEFGDLVEILRRVGPPDRRDLHVGE